MFKKLLFSTVTTISLLNAGNLDLKLSSTFNDGDKWNISMNKNGTYYIMLPIDVEFSELQDSLLDDENMYVYRWYQSSSLFETDFRTKSLVIVNIKKDIIDYNVYNPNKDGGAGYQMVGNSFSDVENFLTNTIAPSITDETKKSIFINSYIPSLSKIDKNRLYLIKPKSSNLNISVDLNLDNSSSESSTSSMDSSSSMSSISSEASSSEESSSSSIATSSEGIETPPDIPDMGTSSSTTVDTPPSVPSL